MAKRPKGYTYNPINPKKPYQAQISINGTTMPLGHYATAEEATAAYVKARQASPIVPINRKKVKQL